MKRPLTIRLSDEARAALGRLSQRENRSLSSWIEWQIRQEAVKQGAWATDRVQKVKVVD